MRFHTNPFFSFFFLAFILFFAIYATASQSEVVDEHPFTYTEESGKGPNKWSQLHPHWEVCGNGKLQSPIDLQNKRVHEVPNKGKLRRDYKPAPAVLLNRGHDIMVQWKGDAGEISINETDYKLQQCHWHTPSEHTINGQKYNMELHAVHQNSKGEIAVVGMLYKYGNPDPFLSKLLHNIKSVGKEEKKLGEINPEEINFESEKYYRYIGSLTVPPCTEGVIWTVVEEARRVSKKQVKALRKAVHDGFEKNARPTQPLQNRTVSLYA